MNLLKSKAFLLSCLVVVVLLIIALIGYKAYSLYTFNTIATNLDSANPQLLSAFKTEIAANNKMQADLIKSLDFGPNFSAAANTKNLTQVKADVESSLKEYKSGVDELTSKSKELSQASSMPLWLDSNQKKFAADISSDLDLYSKARQGDYNYLLKTKPILNSLLQVINDTYSLYTYFLKLASAGQTTILTTAKDNLSDMSSLEKYTKADYKFEGEAALSAEFPDSFKFFKSIKDSYGQTYLAFKALSQGDYSQIAKLNDVPTELQTSLSGLANPAIEAAKKQQTSAIAINDALGNYANTLDFFTNHKLYNNLLSKKVLLAENNQNKAIIVAYLVNQYQTAKDSYPKDASFSSLTTSLDSAGLLDSNFKTLKINSSDFSYTSDGSSYFDIGFKDEVSGQMVKVTVGIKDQSKSQGALNHTTSVEINKVKLNLSFIDTVIGYLATIKH